MHHKFLYTGTLSGFFHPCPSDSLRVPPARMLSSVMFHHRSISLKICINWVVRVRTSNDNLCTAAPKWLHAYDNCYLHQFGKDGLKYLHGKMFEKTETFFPYQRKHNCKILFSLMEMRSDKYDRLLGLLVLWDKNWWRGDHVRVKTR